MQQEERQKRLEKSLDDLARAELAQSPIQTGLDEGTNAVLEGFGFRSAAADDITPIVLAYSQRLISHKRQDQEVFRTATGIYLGNSPRLLTPGRLEQEQKTGFRDVRGELIASMEFLMRDEKSESILASYIKQEAIRDKVMKKYGDLRRSVEAAAPGSGEQLALRLAKYLVDKHLIGERMVHRPEIHLVYATGPASTPSQFSRLQE